MEAQDRDRTPEREVVLATLMRRVGASGVQTHTRSAEHYLQARAIPVTFVNSFSSRSLLLRPVYAARYAIEPVNGEAGVWWYRHWHEYYLRKALAHHLRTDVRDRVIYAQCPVSAAAALRTRTTEPVAMVAHFNISQADEWSHDKGLIRDGGAMYRTIRRLEDEVLPRLDGIVYVSKFMKEVLERRLPALADVPSRVIPNFVATPPLVRQRPTRDIITVGALEVRKNHAYLLDIIAAAAGAGHRYSATIVGEGPDRAQLERRAEDLDVASQVQFVGHHPNPRALMACHRVYCHTSRMESFGIALIEAMSAQLPVLAAPVGGVPEIVRPDVDGMLWELGDAPAAASQLIEMLETPGMAEAMGRAARERVEMEYSDSVIGVQLEHFLLTASQRP
jgi:glycosyltransferase involved in cell wall biosynthesis